MRDEGREGEEAGWEEVRREGWREEVREEKRSEGGKREEGGMRGR